MDWENGAARGVRTRSTAVNIGQHRSTSVKLSSTFWGDRPPMRNRSTSDSIGQHGLASLSADQQWFGSDSAQQSWKTQAQEPSLNSSLSRGFDRGGLFHRWRASSPLLLWRRSLVAAGRQSATLQRVVGIGHFAWFTPRRGGIGRPPGGGPAPTWTCRRSRCCAWIWQARRGPAEPARVPREGQQDRQWGVNKTLAAFRLDVKLRPLLSDHERKFIVVMGLPESQRRPGASCRAFLAAPGEDLREEVPDSMLGVDAIHIGTDQGSVGWAGYQHLFLDMPVNGTFSHDPPYHVRNEAWQRCVVREFVPAGRG